MVAKVSLGQLLIKHGRKTLQNHTHCLNEKCSNISSYLQTDTLLSWLSLLIFKSLQGLMKSVRQISDDRKYKPLYTPAVWHEKIAWLCLTDMARSFIDKLTQPVLSPCHLASSSKIRLDVTNPSVQVILGCRKFSWLNINKGPMCETYVTFQKMYASPGAFTTSIFPHCRA